jgi:RsiW-degrading membrane proteinase PrsW (M82 family)
MNIFSIIIAWLFIMAGYMLWWKFRDDKIHGRNFFNFGDYNFLIAALTSLIAIWIAFSISSPEPSFTDDDKQISFGEKTRQPWLVTNALWKKIAKSPKNTDYHFQLLQNHFQQEDESFSPPDLRAFNFEGTRIFNYYTELTEKENDPVANDIGNLFLADWYIERTGHDAENAAFYLRQIKNKKQKYVNYISGRILLYEAGPEAAEPYFLSEIELHGYKEGAWEGLATVYDMTGRNDDLKKLIYNSESKNSVPENLRYKEYFLSGDLISFYELRFSKMFGTLPLWGILGDFLILFTWLFFLQKLSFLSPIKWKHFFLAIGIGAVLAMFSWLLYEFYHYVLHFWTNGNVGNDFLFSFLGIGFIEELVKLIPFLILLRLTNIIKKPIDYLLVASAAGLGFAFFENLLYISQYGLEVIHSRALTASVSHMASSAIVAYGFVLAKYLYPGKIWIIPVFFLIAALAHGFYDFWLLNNKVHSLAIVTLFFFLSEMLVYVSFLNNSLNQSADEHTKVAATNFNTQQLASFIAGALVLVFVIEYTGTCFVYGTIIGNKTLMNAFLSGGYLIFFLSVRLSNIDIIPGEWKKIEFFTGLLPSDLLRKTKKRNPNAIVGKNLTFLADESSGKVSLQLPLDGTVQRRLTVRGFGDCFEVELTKMLFVGQSETKIIYIRAKNEEEAIGEKARLNDEVGQEMTTVEIFVRFEKEGKSNLVYFDLAVVSL